METERYGKGSIPNSKWATKGKLVFNNYELKYRPDTELVLRNLTFEVNPGEKIGIVGRTGAGKSTICLALCRIVEAHQGRIEIDDVNIAGIELAYLRSRITIIP